MSETEKATLTAGEKEEQKEIFYAILAAYVKNKLVEKEPSYQIWSEKGALIVTRDWLHIISIYAVMLKCCGLSMVFVIDPVLQGDDAKHSLSYAYSRFLAPEKEPNEMYERCVSMMATLLQNASTSPAKESEEGEAPVAKLIEKLLE